MIDYTKQVIAFEKLMLEKPRRLSRSSQIMWHRLMSILNRQEQKKIVQIGGFELANLMGATEKTFLSARSLLEREGFIEYKRGVKASPSRYKLKKLYGETGFGYMG